MIPTTEAAPVQGSPDTRERIIDTAERLFAESGYNAVSLRRILREANANIASAHYYFRTKEGLLQAVMERRVAPMNAERHRLLDACWAQAQDGRPDVAAVVDAFVRPAFRVVEEPGGAVFSRLSGVLSVDPDPAVRAVIYASYDEIAARFVQALRASLPQLSHDEFYYRLNCVYGAMMYVRTDNGRVARLIGPAVDSAAGRQSIRYLLHFLTAGLTAPPLEERDA